MSKRRSSEARGELGVPAEVEDAQDLEEARAALADPDNREPLAWGDLKAQLGLE